MSRVAKPRPFWKLMMQVNCIYQEILLNVPTRRQTMNVMCWRPLSFRDFSAQELFRKWIMNLKSGDWLARIFFAKILEEVLIHCPVPVDVITCLPPCGICHQYPMQEVVQRVGAAISIQAAPNLLERYEDLSKTDRPGRPHVYDRSYTMHTSTMRVNTHHISSDCGSVLVVDDVLATGSTMTAAEILLTNIMYGLHVIGFVFARAVKQAPEVYKTEEFPGVDIHPEELELFIRRWKGRDLE